MKEHYPISHISRLRMGNDGDGVRTLILFQNCTLRCRYCINPFTWNGSIDHSLMTAQEIYNKIICDRPYMLATNGGITFGGGEPLLYSKAIKEISDMVDGQFTIFAETALNVPRKNIDLILNVVDRFYVDIKTLDSIKYHSYTGGNIDITIDNLQYLIEQVGSKRIVVRIPKIPGYTDEHDQFIDKEKLSKMGIKAFDLFDYKIPELHES